MASIVGRGAGVATTSGNRTAQRPVTSASALTPNAVENGVVTASERDVNLARESLQEKHARLQSAKEALSDAKEDLRLRVHDAQIARHERANSLRDKVRKLVEAKRTLSARTIELSAASDAIVAARSEIEPRVADMNQASSEKNSIRDAVQSMERHTHELELERLDAPSATSTELHATANENLDLLRAKTSDLNVDDARESGGDIRAAADEDYDSDDVDARTSATLEDENWHLADTLERGQSTLRAAVDAELQSAFERAQQTHVEQDERSNDVDEESLAEEDKVVESLSRTKRAQGSSSLSSDALMETRAKYEAMRIELVQTKTELAERIRQHHREQQQQAEEAERLRQSIAELGGEEKNEATNAAVGRLCAVLGVAAADEGLAKTIEGVRAELEAILAERRDLERKVAELALIVREKEQSEVDMMKAHETAMQDLMYISGFIGKDGGETTA